MTVNTFKILNNDIVAIWKQLAVFLCTCAKTAIFLLPGWILPLPLFLAVIKIGKTFGNLTTFCTFLAIFHCVCAKRTTSIFTSIHLIFCSIFWPCHWFWQHSFPMSKECFGYRRWLLLFLVIWPENNIFYFQCVWFKWHWKCSVVMYLHVSCILKQSRSSML